LKAKKDDIIKDIQGHMAKLAEEKAECKKAIVKGGKELKDLMTKLNISSKDLEQLRRRAY
jgi:hypothetical protein